MIKAIPENLSRSPVLVLEVIVSPRRISKAHPSWIHHSGWTISCMLERELFLVAHDAELEDDYDY